MLLIICSFYFAALFNLNGSKKWTQIYRIFIQTSKWISGFLFQRASVAVFFSTFVINLCEVCIHCLIENMKIEEAILYCLASQNRGMRTEQIAEMINRQRLHIRKDGQPVTSKQVYAVVCRHPDMFVKAEGRILLMIWMESIFIWLLWFVTFLNFNMRRTYPLYKIRGGDRKPKTLNIKTGCKNQL